MNAKIRRYARLLREGFAGVLRLHPVEALIALYGCAGCLLTYELDWDDALPKLALAPLFFAVAFVGNNLAGQGPWRKLYWVCWVPMVPLTCWSGLGAWFASESSYITFGVLAPLSVLLCRLAVRNERFVGDGVVYLRSGVLALLFANVALGLFYAILYSTTYIFGLEGPWIEHVAVYAVTLCETIGVPVLFLMMTDRWRDAEWRGNRIVVVLLNYIVTPALIIYAAILYLYMVKILVTWSLPEGGVAYLVFGFTLFSLAVAALQLLIEKRIYDWFFDRISLFLLPAQALFWFGVVRRTGEYGLTEPRVYLVVCGGLMTLCVLLFLSRRTGRYFYICLAGLLSFAALAYVPSLEPGSIAVRSQMRRATRFAEKLLLLDERGTLQLDRFAVDTAVKMDYKRLYESLDYLSGHGEGTFDRFGVEMNQVRDALPAEFYSFITDRRDRSRRADRGTRIYPQQPRRTELADGYRTLYSGLSYGDNDDRYPAYRFENDTLRIDLSSSQQFRICGTELIRSQLHRVGLGDAPEMDAIKQAADRFLTYVDDERMILFSQMSLLRRDSLLVLGDVSVEAVLTR